MATPQKVTSAKYLGITFDYYLHWKSHINTTVAKANAAQIFFMNKHHFLSN